MDDFIVGVLANIGIVSFVALSAYVLLLAGEVSFGQQAFFGLGAYAAGMGTAMLKWPLAPALLLGAIVGASTAALVGRATLRLTGLYFAMATLAFAEMMRIAFELFTFQVEVAGRLVGPKGPDGFGDIRYLFENEITPAQYMAGIWVLLAVTLVAFAAFDRSRYGRALRQAGTDPLLAELQGVRVVRVRLVAAAAVAAAAAGYLREREWLDAINAGLWIAIVVMFEWQVRFPAAAGRRRVAFKTAAAVLYAGLGALVAIWLWRGEWMDAYDALLWLAALVVIELNILRGLSRSGRVSG